MEQMDKSTIFKYNAHTRSTTLVVKYITAYNVLNFYNRTENIKITKLKDFLKYFS